MKIAIFDSGWNYTLDTPYDNPLGGTQSAICYFLEEMKSRNHEIVWKCTFSPIPSPYPGDNDRIINLHLLPPHSLLQSFQKEWSHSCT